MVLTKIRQHRISTRWCEGVLRKNPVLVCGLALPFAVMASSNLKNSAAVSILMVCSLLPPVLLASLIGRRLHLWITGMLCSLLSLCLLVVALPLVQMISPEIIGSLNISIPILSVNTILLFLISRHTKHQRNSLHALADALCYSVGFAFALLLIGAVRELVGNNALWGVPITMPFKLSGLQFAFAGFLLAGVFSAFFRFVQRGVKRSAYQQENPLPKQEVRP